MQEKYLLDNSPVVSEEYYKDADILNQQIKNPNIKNIAVVGNLGAGKSSVIETYLAQYRVKRDIQKKDYQNADKKFDKYKYKHDKKEIKKHNKEITNSKYVKISLATFNDKKFEENDIEKSVLQQLLYSQNKNKLPNSKIERTNKSSWKKILLFTGFLTLFVISSILFGLGVSSANFLGNTIWPSCLFLGIMAVSILVILYYCIYYKIFKKIKYKDFELETQDNKNTSSLINKLIDEILYFFECIDVDLVIFEDLDRLSSDEIFIKLRELNTIINNSSNKNCKKITFLYAIKSEVIKDREERAKFFDFILPIIPVINPTTTEERIREFIKQSKSNNYELSDGYIQDIALYIPDMRILKNTFNDYFITRNRIVNKSNQDRISNEKLFTISLFRSLFPSEYTKLESNSGTLPVLLNKKFLVEILTNKLDEENAKHEEKIENLKNEALQNFDELKYILKGIITNTKSHQYVNNSSISVDSIQTFKGLNIENIIHPNNPSFRVEVTPEIRDIIDRVNFEQREQNIRDNSENKIEELLRFIELNQKEKQNINSLTFEELVDKIGIEKIFNNKHINEKRDFNQTQADQKLLNFCKFIIKNKYIDDRYSEYTHNLSSSIISQGDIEFIKKIQSGTNDFNYKIENLDEVLKRLKVDDFKDASIINKVILQNIGTIKDTHKKELINTLSSSNNNSWEYIAKFCMESNDSEIINLINYLVTDYNLCKKAINAPLIENKKDIIINTIIKKGDNISNYNLDGCLTNYISNKQDLNRLITGLSESEVINLLESLKPKILHLSDKLCPKQLIKFIISKNFYQINIENLTYALRFKQKYNVDFMLKNYQYIEKTSIEIFEYIKQNLNDYITNILLKTEVVNTEENSKTVCDFLYKKDVDIDNKRKLIYKFRINIQDLEGIDDELLEPILEFNRMIPSWDNILAVYNKLGLQSTLLDYILKNINGITQIEVNKINKALIYELLNSSQFDEMTYKSLANKINNKLSITEINNDDNLAILIQLDKFDYNSTDFSILKDYPKALNEYLSYFANSINNEITTFFAADISVEILNNILLSENVPIDLKQKVVMQFSKKIRIIGFEQQYAELFITKKLRITEDILFQFINYEVDKYSLISLTEFNYASSDTIQKIKDFLCTCNEAFTDLFKNNQEFKIANTEKNKEWISNVLPFNILKYSKRKEQITLKSINC